MGSEEYTFDRFIVGSSNRFAYNAALAVAEDPGRATTPCSSTGSPVWARPICSTPSTTHQGHHPDYQIIYIKGDEFTNELSEAIRLRKTDAFRQKYRDKDLLLVDDIHFIAGKEQNPGGVLQHLQQPVRGQCQIVLTSDRPLRHAAPGRPAAHPL